MMNLEDSVANVTRISWRIMLGLDMNSHSGMISVGETASFANVPPLLFGLLVLLYISPNFLDALLLIKHCII